MNYTIKLPARTIVTNKTNLASVIDSLIKEGHTIFRISKDDKVVEPGPKYKVGDQVRIIAEQNAHKFQIGEIVTIVGIDSSDVEEWTSYKASNGQDWWLIGTDECEPVNK